MNISVISRFIPDGLVTVSNRSTSMNLTICKKFSNPLHFFIVRCAFQISPDYHVNDIKIKTSVLFLDATFFFHTFARSIPAQKFTNLAMSAFTLVLTCNIALFWWPRKLNDVQFSMHVSCSGMSLWRHITPPFKAMALRSSTHTQQHTDLAGHNQCLQLIPGQFTSVRESMRAKGTRGHPLEVHATFFYQQNLLNASILWE